MSTKNTLDKARSLLAGSVEQFAQACRVLQWLVQEGRYTTTDMEGPMRLSKKLLDQYIDVGTGRVKPELVYYQAEHPGFRKMQRLPRAVQDDLWGQQVEVAVRRNGRYQGEKIGVEFLTAEQANLVFSQQQVRTYAQQVQHLNTQARKDMDVKLSFAYAVTDTGVVLQTPRTYTESELKQLLKLCRKARSLS